MIQILVAAIPAVVAAVVSLVTYFDNKKSKLAAKVDQLEKKFDYEMACQARTRILRFNNELMCGQNHTKDYFDDIIENSIDVYERYYNDPNHKNMKNGIAKSAVKNIYRIYDYKIQTNTFLQYPSEVNQNEGNPDIPGRTAC